EAPVPPPDTVGHQVPPVQVGVLLLVRVSIVASLQGQAQVPEAQYLNKSSTHFRGTGGTEAPSQSLPLVWRPPLNHPLSPRLPLVSRLPCDHVPPSEDSRDRISEPALPPPLQPQRKRSKRKQSEHFLIAQQLVRKHDKISHQIA
ncbi:unnamed protein product, partial [Amoebophrya sp. A120]